MLALIALGVLLSVLLSLVSESSLIIVPFNAVSAFLLVFVLRRYGLLALSARSSWRISPCFFQ